MCGLFYLKCLLILMTQCYGKETHFDKDTEPRATFLNEMSPYLEDILSNIILMSERQNERISTLESTVQKLTMAADEIQGKYAEQLKINNELKSKIAEIQDVMTTTSRMRSETGVKSESLVKGSKPTDGYKQLVPTNGNAIRNSSRTKQFDSDNTEIDTRFEEKKYSRAAPLPIRIKKLLEEGTVAFSAYLDYILRHITVGDTIKFNKILYNAGHGYNSITGVFTAPLTGAYFFTFTIHSQTTETNMQMVLDDKNLVDAVTHADSSGLENNMATNSAVIYVLVGQSVWIKAVTDKDSELVSTPNFRQVTFSGFLIS